MSDAQDGAEKFALTVVGLLVTAVVAGVVGFGAMRGAGRAGAGPAAEVTAGGAVVEAVQFTPEGDQLPPTSTDGLSRIAMAARSRQGAVVVVLVPRTDVGSAGASEDLALRRAEQLRHALEANGVPRDQVILGSPLPGAPAPAHRAELRVE